MLPSIKVSLALPNVATTSKLFLDKSSSLTAAIKLDKSSLAKDDCNSASNLL